MKKLSVVFIVLIIFFSSCLNQTTYDETTYDETVTVLPIDFIQQPIVKLVDKNEPISFSCKAIMDNNTIYYQWYETDNGGKKKIPIGNEWSTSSLLEVEPFTEKGIRYFVCGALNYKPYSEEIPSDTVFSNITAASYTGLPVITISTPDQCH